MSSHVASVTDRGLVRARNEDSGYAGRCLCAVADGMGGHVAGDVASAEVIEAIRPFDVRAASPGQLLAILGAAVRAANQRLMAKAQADPGLAGMGSTLTALLWSGTSLAVAHIGDSRAYRLRNGALAQITEDHVMSRLVESPMPPQIGEYLVRFLDARPGWSPDLTLRSARPGDRYLICSDGLSGVVGPDAIRDVLAGTPGLEEAVQALLRLAYQAGAPDNVTIIAIDVPGGAWQEQGAAPVVLGAAASAAVAT